MPLNLVLVEPEIPQNTGNIARTCAATGCRLHLVRPLGFAVTDKHLKRAGLDYWSDVEVVFHDSLAAFLEAHGRERLWLSTTRGNLVPDQVRFSDGDWLVFGRETAGLPGPLIEAYPGSLVRIPMRTGQRSLNLSNAAAVLTYEALRQLGWPGMGHS
ncbi:MAG TPA: tRNA (uridine(34)/cytosine(34)/5-carboxymethylaminomethyluridine(34)-2'-O)-methyltransferase TrmL [Spirochaetia bacterium]|nr:tRNA (uridine(34)/cytosine(34)/5-carboxymethylaminomethyluridine(34)-2'-O)-methyltransferase TrmL [Spirochaetia bacterium]